MIEDCLYIPLCMHVEREREVGVKKANFLILALGSKGDMEVILLLSQNRAKY